MSRRAAAVLVLLTISLLSSPGASALLKSDDAVDLAKKISADPSYQRDLPETQGKVDSLERWSKRQAGFRFRRSSAVSPAGLSIVHLLFYLAMGLALGLALVWLLSSWQARERKAATGRDAGSESAADAGPEPEMAGVLDLARRGLFAEAIHELLLLAVYQLLRRQQRDGGTGFLPDDSLTGRELVRVLPRDAQERQRFAHLVTAVEHSLFAGRQVDEVSFQACLESYRGLRG